MCVDILSINLYQVLVVQTSTRLKKKKKQFRNQFIGGSNVRWFFFVKFLLLMGAVETENKIK